MITIIDKTGTAIITDNFEIITDSTDIKEIVEINLFIIENDPDYIPDALGTLADALTPIYDIVNVSDEEVDDEVDY